MSENEGPQLKKQKITASYSSSSSSSALSSSNVDNPQEILRPVPLAPPVAWRVVAKASLSRETDEENNNDNDNDRVLFRAFCRNLGITHKTFNLSDMTPIKIDAWIATLNYMEGTDEMLRAMAKGEWWNQLMKSHEYFYTIDDLIRVKRETDSNPDSPPSPFKRDQLPNWREYTKMKITEEKFTDGKLAHFNLDEKSARSFNGTVTKNRIWQCDIFGRELKRKAPDAQVAHLIPHYPSNAVEWVDIACWAFGYDPKDTKWGIGLRLLNGIQKETSTEREKGSGIRNFQVNRLRINGQKTLIDGKEPSVLIIPIRTAEQCRDWNGEGYDAIVLALHGDAFNNLGAYDDSNIQNDATLYEVETAIDLLRECTSEMVKSMKIDLKDERDEDPNVKNTTKTAKGIREKREQEFTSDTKLTANANQFPLPELRANGQNLNLDYRGVCKVSFSHARDCIRTQNPAPDPLLLVAKASVGWSVMNNMRLLAGDGPTDDDDSSDDSDNLQFVLPPLLADYPLPLQLKRKPLIGSEVECNKQSYNNNDDDASSISSSSFMESIAKMNG